MFTPTIYLAGAIRDEHVEDITWRELFVHRLSAQATIWSPLAGKHRDPTTGVWTLDGRPSTAKMIVSKDFWMVDRADIIVFNFLSVREGYPSIGTTMEFGRSTARSVLRYCIFPVEFTGLHPFYAENATDIFDTPEACCDFLEGHLPRITGSDAHYEG